MKTSGVQEEDMGSGVAISLLKWFFFSIRISSHSPHTPFKQVTEKNWKEKDK